MDKSLYILLVEDDKLSQAVGKLSFKEIGSILDIASSGNEATQLANKNQYDLIFMDIGLGDIDGFETAVAIRKNGKNQKTPIIALTAHSDTELQNFSQKVGMNDYLIKPLTLDKIHKVLNQFLPCSKNNS